MENQVARDHEMPASAYHSTDANSERPGGSARGRTPGAPIDPTAPSKARRRPLRLELVLDEAQKLLADVGLDALSLRGLAARLGVTAPALYAHVDDKNDLLRRLGEDGYERLIARFLPLPDAGPIEQIHHIARAYVEFARENPEQFRTMFMFRPDIPGVISGEALNHAGEAFTIAMNTVDEAVDAGLIESDDKIMTNLTIWGAVHGMTTVILAGGCQFESDMGLKLIQNIVDSILRGMTPSSRPATQAS